MRRFRSVSCFVAAAAIMIVGCGVSSADTIGFSFSNDPTGPGNVAGTVTGELLGLPHSGTGPATGVIIDGYPAALVLSGSYTTPFDALAWSGTVNENSFSVVDGVIVGGSFSIVGGNGVDDQLYIDSQCACSTFGLGLGTNFFDIGSGDSLFVWNDNGMGPGGVTFGSAVPEPGTWVLLAGGLIALGFRRTRRS